MYKRKKDGIFHDPRTGRMVEHRRYSVHIYWSPAMLEYLRRHYPTTFNDELAECLGVSRSTMSRKVRELGLKKDPVWLKRVYDERRRMACAASRRMGYPGSFKPGAHAYPPGEFKKGMRRSPEVIRKCSEAMRRWYLQHPHEAKEKAEKIRQRRRALQQTGRHANNDMGKNQEPGNF